MGKLGQEDIVKLIVEVDILIRSGKASLARVLIKKLFNIKALPREFALPLATLARRADLVIIGLKLLNPIVRPSEKKFTLATEEEKVEYAFCLSLSGADIEALRILKDVDSKKVPQALLATSFSYIGVWDYASALPHLKNYVAVTELDNYQRIVGNVNLVSALVWEGFEKEAEELIVSLLEQTKKGKLSLLHGKLLSFRAQNAIYSRKWDKAGKFLAEAKEYLYPMGGIDVLFIDKWHAIYDVYVNQASSSSLQKLKVVRARAVEIKHWETVRQCDYYESVLTQNQKLALHVYFGTPHESFRLRLLKDFTGNLDLTKAYSWKLGSQAKEEVTIEVLLRETKSGIKFGHASHRALMALSSDFYRPLKVTTIHFKLFPNENFNPFSSPDRVHQALKRLRHVLVKSRIPLEIKEENGMYALTSSKSAKVLIPLLNNIQDRSHAHLETLRARIGEKSFSVSEAAKILSMSTRGALKILQKALEHNEVIRTGTGSKCKYTIMSLEKKAA